MGNIMAMNTVKQTNKNIIQLRKDYEKSIIYAIIINI